jgi:hypothetical protein
MENINLLPEKLKEKKDFDLNMMIGLDGFVDEIVHIVDKRIDHENYTRILTIAEFGERLSNAAGLGTNVEFVPVYAKLGGNGPILTNALLEYGVSLTYVGLLGKPSIHPVFQDMVSKLKAVYSLCEPGHTDACEFEDGKIMIGKHASPRELTWELFRDSLGGPEGIAEIIDENELIGMENWTMLPHMSDIWEGIINEVFPLLIKKAEKPYAFFDLADPEKRTKEDIRHAMELISRFEDKFHTILGLNEKEAYGIADALGIELDENHPDRLRAATMALYEKMGIYCMMVHPVRSACCVIDGEYYYTEGPYCAKPKLTTGAGDNFNAGFCLGLTIGLDPLSALTLGVCTSGFYVRNAHSPTYDQVIEFAKKWADGKVEE